MQKAEALAALRSGKTLSADWPDSDSGVVAAHLMPEGEQVRWRRYLGDHQWAPDFLLTWEQLDAWADDAWQEWGF